MDRETEKEFLKVLKGIESKLGNVQGAIISIGWPILGIMLAIYITSLFG